MRDVIKEILYSLLNSAGENYVLCIERWKAYIKSVESTLRIYRWLAKTNTLRCILYMRDSSFSSGQSLSNHAGLLLLTGLLELFCKQASIVGGHA